MSLKSRLLKNREAKSFVFSHEDTEIDLISYFKENSELNTITAYSHDKIFGESDGQSSQLFMAFSSTQKYLEEIERIIRLYGAEEKNPHIVINVTNSIYADIYMPPLVNSEPLICISRQKKSDNEKFFNQKLISSEISDYLKACLNRKTNIFIIGNASSDKIPLMNILAKMPNSDKKLIFCENEKKMNSEKPCIAEFSTDILNSNPNLKYDNIFCPDISAEELVKIFKLIISGYNGFVVSLSVKSGIDILSAVRNMVLLSNINLFEENADFMVTSSMEVIIFADKTENNETRITKIAEMSKNKIGEFILKDIFVWNKLSERHLSTGNISAFANIPSEIFDEARKHKYLSNTPQTTINPIPQQQENMSKIDKLKEKIKRKSEKIKLLPKYQPVITNTETEDVISAKTEIKIPEIKLSFNSHKSSENEENAIPVSQNENIETIENTEILPQENNNFETAPFTSEEDNNLISLESQSAENTEVQTENQETDAPTEELEEQDIYQNEPIITPENQEEIAENDYTEFVDDSTPVPAEIVEEEPDYSGRIDIEQIDLIDENASANEGLLANENDGFIYPAQQKIRNIFEEDSEDKFAISEEDIDETADVETLIKQAGENNYSNFTEKYEEAEQEHFPKEPELFEEINDVDVDNYDVPDIPDDI